MKVLIIGSDKTSYYLTRRFIAKGYHAVMITHDAQQGRQMARKLQALVVVGDGTDPLVLDEAGVRQCAIVVALLPHDHDNLIACQLAKEMFGVPRTVALVHDPENEEVFRQLGVSVAVSVARLLVQVIEEQIGYEAIINLAELAQGQLAITEVVLLGDAPAIGQHLRDLALPDNALVAAVIRDDGSIIPRGETQLQLNDHLLLVTRPDNHSIVLSILMGATA